MQLSDRLRIAVALRQECTATVADKLGVARSTVNSWNKGNTEPTIKQIQSIAQFLRVSPAWLGLGDGEMLMVSDELPSQISTNATTHSNRSQNQAG